MTICGYIYDIVGEIHMNIRKQWDIYFREHKHPCFIVDRYTNEILYCNNEFSRVVEINKTPVGKKFFDVVLKRDVHIEGEAPDWDQVDYFETKSYNKKLHRKFMLKSIKMEDGNSIFCEMVPLENILYDNELFEKAVVECMGYYEMNTGNIHKKMMRLLTEFYNCERAYIYSFYSGENTINCVEQWCESEEFRVTEEIGTKICAGKIMEWLARENSVGIVRASNKDDLDKNSMEYEVLEKFQLTNVTLCNVLDVNNHITGFVGISNCQGDSTEFDPRLLHTISRLVAQEVGEDKLKSDLEELHYRDKLTGLHNRAGYAKNLTKIMEASPKSMGIVSVNINGLRYINEQVGVEKGDVHIREAAMLLRDHFNFEFFRMSGDELIGIAVDVDEDDFEMSALRLYSKMRKENRYDFSVGHAWTNKDINAMKLTAEANVLMYINKQQYYAEGKTPIDSLKDTVLAELLEHLKDEEFMVYLQPQVWLKDGSLYGAEALIRMYDKKLNKMVFPDQFIPLYEENSVIRHLDMFVLESVCKLQQEWVKLGKRIPVSVNFSRITLQEYGIVKAIAEVCDKYDVPHNLVVIEITERVGLINNNVASALVTDFKEQGFHLSLDDFGCAYSNIITLAQIEVDEVKIDKSLVDFILSNKKNKVLVKSILSMCNELEGTATLAEGIEESEQGELLYQLGCTLGQGYHYSRPIPVEEFVDKYI